MHFLGLTWASNLDQFWFYLVKPFQFSQIYISTTELDSGYQEIDNFYFIYYTRIIFMLDNRIVSSAVFTIVFLEFFHSGIS